MAASDELVAIAQEQLRWVRAAALPEVRRTIEQTLSTTEYRRGYEALDGSKTGAEVATTLGVSEATVSRWARRWRNLGVAYEYSDARGGRRTKHLVSLEDLGLPIEVNGES